jgi:hypothetical protein
MALGLVTGAALDLDRSLCGLGPRDGGTMSGLCLFGGGAHLTQGDAGRSELGLDITALRGQSLRLGLGPLASGPSGLGLASGHLGGSGQPLDLAASLGATAAVGLRQPRLGLGPGLICLIGPLLQLLKTLGELTGTFLGSTERSSPLLSERLGLMGPSLGALSLLHCPSQRLLGRSPRLLGSNACGLGLLQTLRFRTLGSCPSPACLGRSLFEPLPLDDSSIGLGPDALQERLLPLPFDPGSLCCVLVALGLRGIGLLGSARQGDGEGHPLYPGSIGRVAPQADHQPSLVASAPRPLTQGDPFDLRPIAIEVSREPLQTAAWQIDDQSVG